MEGEVRDDLLYCALFSRLSGFLVLHYTVQQKEALAYLFITVVSKTKAVAFLLLGLGEALDRPALHNDCCQGLGGHWWRWPGEAWGSCWKERTRWRPGRRWWRSGVLFLQLEPGIGGCAPLRRS